MRPRTTEPCGRPRRDLKPLKKLPIWFCGALPQKSLRNGNSSCTVLNTEIIGVVLTTSRTIGMGGLAGPQMPLMRSNALSSSGSQSGNRGSAGVCTALFLQKWQTTRNDRPSVYKITRNKYASTVAPDYGDTGQNFLPSDLNTSVPCSSVRRTGM